MTQAIAGPSLLQRATGLQVEVVDLAQLRRMANQAQAFATRAAQLGDPTNALEGWLIVLTMFRERGITVEVDVSKIAGIRAEAARFADAYEKDPDSILKPDGQLRFKFWATLEQLPGELRVALLAAWAHYANGVLPPRQDGLLDTLSNVPGFQVQVDELRRLYAQGEQLRREIPTTVIQLDAPDQLARRIRDALGRLHGDGLSNEVLVFLRSASAGAATLESLTDDVVDWLGRHSLRSAVRVSLRTGT